MQGAPRSRSKAVERLLGWFEDGTLLRPGTGAPTTVDLANALASLGGVSLPLTQGARQIEDAIGPCEHLVFVLVDGLGQSMVERRAAGGLFRRSWRMELRSVFPSATAAALTSLATGLWPAEHAVPGWWTHLPDRELTVTSLPCIERFGGASFESIGLPPEAVFGAPTLLQRYRRDVASLLPAHIATSMYSRYWRGDTPTAGWKTFAAGVDRVLERVRAARGPTYTYLYTPAVDTAAHLYGPQSVALDEVIAAVERELERLQAGLPRGARMALSSDHGQIEVTPAARTVLAEDDPLSRLLLVPPSGEARCPLLHLRPGEGERFRALFEARFGERWALLEAREAEALELFGPGPLGERARERIGDFVAVARDPEVLVTLTGHESHDTLGYHGGLLPDEVRIPLLVT